MRKKFVLFSVIALALAGTVTTSCSKDDENEPAALNPNGVVVISAPQEVCAGQVATIKFRVNPSNVSLTPENVSLDCVVPNVYEVQISEAEAKYNGTGDKKSKVSYVQTSDSYKVLSVCPDSLNGQQLAGQYVLQVLAQSERNIIDKSQWAIVCSYKTDDGDANVSSASFAMSQIPQVKDGVFAWSPQAVSLKAGKHQPELDGRTPVGFLDPTINGVKWFVSPRTYKNPLTNDQLTYDYDKCVANYEVNLLNGTDTIQGNSTATEYSIYQDGCLFGYTVVPFSDLEPIASIYDGSTDRKFVTFTNSLRLADKYGNISEWSQDVNYVVPQIITLRVDLPEEVVTGYYNVVDVEKTFADYGIDLSMLDRYPGIRFDQSFIVYQEMSQAGCMLGRTMHSSGLGVEKFHVYNDGSTVVTPEFFCSNFYTSTNICKNSALTDDYNTPYYKILNVIYKFVPNK